MERRGRRLFGRLPESPRCDACYAPFSGIGAPLVRIFFGRKQSTRDPRFCNQCTEYMREHPGGTEIEISMLFADVRGSSRIAEGRSPTDFSAFINRFYRESTRVLIQTEALIDRLIGDEVVGIYVPGLAGEQHALRAVEAARDILRVTGHGDPDGPWAPVGAGVHTGLSYVGTVGEPEGAMDLTALGDVPNTAAHLAAAAAPGEVIVSGAACTAAALSPEEFEVRQVSLKGRSQPQEVAVLRVMPE